MYSIQSACQGVLRALSGGCGEEADRVRFEHRKDKVEDCLRSKSLERSQLEDCLVLPKDPGVRILDVIQIIQSLDENRESTGCLGKLRKYRV